MPFDFRMPNAISCRNVDLGASRKETERNSPKLAANFGTIRYELQPSPSGLFVFCASAAFLVSELQAGKYSSFYIAYVLGFLVALISKDKINSSYKGTRRKSSQWFGSSNVA